MAAQSTPEIIVPGNLYIPDGKVGYSISDGIMPNGDNAFTITNEAGADKFSAYTEAGDDFLLGSDPCAVSFWFRRRQNFGGSSMSAGIRTDPIDNSDKMIMGVVDPLVSDTNTFAEDNKIAWGLYSYGSSAVQLVVSGYFNGSPYWDIQGHSTIGTNVWTLVVINRTQAALTNTPTTGQHGYMSMYFNGTLMSTNSNALWSHLGSVSQAGKRFCIGDNTMKNTSTGGNTEIGASAGAAWDISHLAFHDRMLTIAEQLEMFESMMYGPETA